ncbi:hypothetical protein KR018_004733 [Drosophila ironensis]|nr:hypothetical protein KR018_004733 [Drosophila ironensis]
MSVASAVRRHHRVVVALGEPKRVGYGEENDLNGDLKLLDNKTMLLRMPNSSAKAGSRVDAPRYYRQLEFDAIGFESEHQLRAELNGFMAQIFRQRCNGSLLRFAAQRSLNPNLFTRLFVTEVDKLMLELRCRIKAINVDYFDVRKFDMVNLLVEPSAVNNRHRILQSGKSVSSTRELFQWLINDFAALRGRGIGDDYLDFQFVFRNAQQNQHKIHLSIFQIFTSDQRADVAEFFKSLTLGRPGGGTLLKDCLKESFDDKNPIPALIMFELPAGDEMSETRRKILKLADTAFTSLTKAQWLMAGRGAKSEPKNGAHSSITQLSKETQPSFPRTPVKSAPDCSLPHWRRTAKLSEEDYNGLAYWYGRIDTKFAELKLSMEQHLVNLYKRKSSNIRSELRSLHEDLHLEDDQSGGDGERPHTLIEDVDSTKTTYMELLKQFQKLDQEAAKTGYAHTLKVYISTKTYELAAAEKRVKQREVENLRINLMQFMSTQDMKIPQECEWT